MDDDLREAARKRIAAKRSFWHMLGVFVAIAIVLNLVWLMSGYRSYYWPAWPMIGFGIATLFSALSTFGPGSKPISEAAVNKEMRKMNGEE